MSILFGKKVPPAFRTRVVTIATALGVSSDDLMLCMAFESGQTFSPSVKNGAGSGATGLIQFMPQTAAAMGTSTIALAQMTAVDQLDYVEQYFKPWRGRLRNVGDLYMAILWPIAVGKPDSYVLFSKTGSARAYAQNKGLDFNGDGLITRGEALRKVEALRATGEKFRG